jgi:hypothetical protein
MACLSRTFASNFLSTKGEFFGRHSRGICTGADWQSTFAVVLECLDTRVWLAWLPSSRSQPAARPQCGLPVTGHPVLLGARYSSCGFRSRLASVLPASRSCAQTDSSVIPQLGTLSVCRCFPDFSVSSAAQLGVTHGISLDRPSPANSACFIVRYFLAWGFIIPQFYGSEKKCHREGTPRIL